MNSLQLILWWLLPFFCNADLSPPVSLTPAPEKSEPSTTSATSTHALEKSAATMTAPVARELQASASDFSFECPPIGYSEAFSLTDLQTVTLKTVSNGLCTLSLEEEGLYIPIARSYDGHSWEKSGSNYVSTMKEWSCEASDCTNTLPQSGKYVLRSRKVNFSNDAAKARFLEAASFGPTRASMADTSAFTDHIKTQINLPQTSHREFFRRNMQARWQFHHSNFAASLNPCTPNSTWRRHLVTEKDAWKTLKVRIVDGRYEVTIDGHVRGMLKNLRFENSTDVFLSGQSYQLCSTNSETYRRNVYSVRIGRRACKAVMADDLVVDFPDSYIPDLVLGETVPALSDDQWRSMSDFNLAFRFLGTIPANSCRQIPVDRLHTDPPVFAKTADGEWLVFDPRINVQENSVAFPLSDGGYADFQANRTKGCANVHRSFLNEHACVMSSSLACPAGAGSTLETAAKGVIVCGSQGEVASDTTAKDSWLDMQSIEVWSRAVRLPKDTTSIEQFRRQREFVWSHIALTSQDQLRQRVAWCLSSIFSLPPASISNQVRQTEIFLAYYDIFVRNAFGNYGDVLKEITYSPLMAMSLTYEDNRSIGSTGGTTVYPDENFARELMQLFTIGLVELNMDGTPVLDIEGKPLHTYDSEDIQSFSRVWTGFDVHGGFRANVDGVNSRAFDPMRIRPWYRDRFPKSDLGGGYFGDGVPLCVDLPEKSFLSKGAKYRLLGTSPIPEMIVEKAGEKISSSSARRFEIFPSSKLYTKLCGETNEGSCTYPALVVLDEPNLECTGIECDVDSVRLVKVNDVFYEHIRVPCVEQSFFQNPQKIAQLRRWSSPMCVHPKLAIASEACCPEENLQSGVSLKNCLFAGERMTMSTAAERCPAGMQLCDYNQLHGTEECPINNYHWTNQPCQLFAKINADGEVAIVHHSNSQPPVTLREETATYFKAYWEGDSFPSPSNSCGDGACSFSENACLCEVNVSDEPVFTEKPRNRVQIINQKLRIGHAAPELYGDKFEKKAGKTFFYHSPDGSCCDIDTVFEYKDGQGVQHFLKNVKSTVNIAGTSFAFRNPPQFNSAVPTEYSIADAEYETDAVLDYLLHHKNTPPFVAYRYIQRFGISNPSPLYIKAVATAFQTGTYRSNGVRFGSGRFGDLEATIAACLLHREALSMSLTHDPSHGSLREPIIKVIGFMRAAEFNLTTPILQMYHMISKVGQQAHQQPSVFSFFRPEYMPSGPATTAQLIAPESQILSSGKILSMMNGLYELIEGGLKECDFGFGAFEDCGDEPSGRLTFNSSIEELSLLLTGGRLDAEKQVTISQAVKSISDPEKAFQASLQLLAASPEFHTTQKVDDQANQAIGTSQSTEVPRNPGYKAVVHLFLSGGCDSYNTLVPDPTDAECIALSSEYKATRGGIAMKDNELLQLFGNTEGQPCNSFGLHHKLPNLQKMYQDSELLFVANAGVLTEPVDKATYKAKTLTQLFAHNAMSIEAQELDPQEQATGTGTLGRIGGILYEKGYKIGRTSIASGTRNLASLTPGTPSTATIEEGGVASQLSIDPSLALELEILNGGLSGKQSGVLGETWSALLRDARNQTESLFSLLENSETQTSFAEQGLGKRLSLIAQLIANRDGRDVDRDFFFVSMDGYDSHGGVKSLMDKRFDEVNEAVGAFVAEMKAMGIWDDVVIVQTSEFGRTMTPNSKAGTDHGWAGNYWMAGGDVNGKRILGKYPPVLADQMLNRGRMIPTTPFDSIFHGVANWVGLTDEDDLDSALPNRHAFPELFTGETLFKS